MHGCSGPALRKSSGKPSPCRYFLLLSLLQLPSDDSKASLADRVLSIKTILQQMEIRCLGGREIVVVFFLYNHGGGGIAAVPTFSN